MFINKKMRKKSASKHEIKIIELSNNIEKCEKYLLLLPRKKYNSNLIKKYFHILKHCQVK